MRDFDEVELDATHEARERALATIERIDRQLAESAAERATRPVTWRDPIEAYEARCALEQPESPMVRARPRPQPQPAAPSPFVSRAKFDSTIDKLVDAIGAEVARLGKSAREADAELRVQILKECAGTFADHITELRAEVAALRAELKELRNG